MARSTSVAMALLATASALFTNSAHAWPQFMKSVPNGNSTLPFEATDLGHAEGSMLRNKFGLAFNVPREWTTTLCEADSDGDGQTNGQELGDPCCIWSAKGATQPHRTIGISNPGNKSSTADPSLWKSLDCAAVRLSASAATTAAPSPSATSSASSVLPPGVVIVTGAAALVAVWK